MNTFNYHPDHMGLMGDRLRNQERKQTDDPEKGRQNMMNKKVKIFAIVLAVLLAAGIAAAGFFAGKAAGRNRAAEEQKQLYELNRSSIEKLNLEDGPIYVIGHRSPDSDTVCSAMAYARLLTMLGYEAEAAVTEDVNRETVYILGQANVQVPPVWRTLPGKTYSWWTTANMRRLPKEWKMRISWAFWITTGSEPS